ncbi:MAG: SMI1/KNR4 family protein [Saprospiraceae bacterium]|nr:SMI1/KNR4 family protein [Saprospiraceae bacterium]
MDYLDHLGRVLDIERRKIQISNLEIELNRELPVLLKIFYLIYQVNDLRKLKKSSHIDFNLLVYDEERNYTNGMALFISKYKEFGYDITLFYEFDSIKNVIKNFFNDDFLKYQNDYIVIGETSWHFPIMIGINSKNCDKVYVYDLDKDQLVFLADSIFEYLMNIKLDFSNNYNLPEGKSVDDLYKNWGEDFWRVRQDA